MFIYFCILNIRHLGLMMGHEEFFVKIRVLRFLYDLVIYEPYCS
jgi:hypothetical protein